MGKTPRKMSIKDRLGAGPFDFVRRAVLKGVVGPLKYRSRRGYDARRYWGDRFRRYGVSSIRGAGHEGLSEEENRQQYEEAGVVFTDLLRRELGNFDSARFLEIGSGQGFYTQIAADLGVKAYTGVDITDVLFAELSRRFPDYRFLRRDVTSDPLEGEYDVVVMIDVSQHIVTEEQITGAMGNIGEVIAPGGLFLIGPLVEQGGRHMFHVRWWSVDEIRQRFPGFDHSTIPFRNGELLCLRRRSGN